MIPVVAQRVCALLFAGIGSTHSFAAASSGTRNTVHRQPILDTIALTRREAGLDAAGASAYTNATLASKLGKPKVNLRPAATQPRFGHTAIYNTEDDTIVFVGGQLDVNTSSTTEITNQALSLDPASVESELEAMKSWSKNLPANAWAASAVDNRERVWLIGGLTADCSKDATVHVFDGQKWSSPKLKPKAPPRRRQARAVAFSNSTTGGTDIFVLGGIAERETCSEGTIGYRGIDRYDTVSNTVETFGWDAPAGAKSDFEPPVSDYTATLLSDGKTIAVIGGQTASGAFSPMKSILLFDIVKRRWTMQVSPERSQSWRGHRR